MDYKETFEHLFTKLNEPNDHYLCYGNYYGRLKDELNKYGKLVVAYDFDDTVYDFHNKGRSYTNIIELLRRLKNLDIAYLVVYTCSEKERYEEIKNYLIENNIPFDSINELPDEIKGKVPSGNKLYYNVLLDDRAGLDMPYNALSTLCLNIEERNRFIKESNKRILDLLLSDIIVNKKNNIITFHKNTN